MIETYTNYNVKLTVTDTTSSNLARIFGLESNNEDSYHQWILASEDVEVAVMLSIPHYLITSSLVLITANREEPERPALCAPALCARS